MPLPPPITPREPLHRRRYDFQGYARDDGLWDIEGRIIDQKSYDIPNDWRGTIRAGEHLHDISARLTVTDGLEVRAAQANIDNSPFAICPAITPNIERIIGLKIGKGWRAGLRQALGKTNGCTHLVEMLGAMGTVAFQTLAAQRALRDQESSHSQDEPPPLLGSCHAFAPDSSVVKSHWPAFWTGKEQPKKDPGHE